MNYLTCIEGYVLEAKKTCKALGENAALLLANENTLRKIYPYAYHKMVDLHPGKKIYLGGFPHIFILKVFNDSCELDVILVRLLNQNFETNSQVSAIFNNTLMCNYALFLFLYCDFL